MNTKNKPVKPRKFWVNFSDLTEGLWTPRFPMECVAKKSEYGHGRPVLVIDLSEESVEALIEKGCHEIDVNWCYPNPAQTKREILRNALKAIGIKATKPRKSK